MKGIADTGLLVAFANRNDDHHRWALEVVERIDPPLLTCEAVLAETAFHLQNTAVVVYMARKDWQKSPSALPRGAQTLAALAKKYRDRQPGSRRPLSHSVPASFTRVTASSLSTRQISVSTGAIGET